MRIGQRIRIKESSPSSMRGRAGRIVKIDSGGSTDLRIHVRLDEPTQTLTDDDVWVMRPDELENDNGEQVEEGEGEATTSS